MHDVYRVATDADGFIVPSRVHAAAALDIVFLGGSTTETMFVSEDKRFPYLVGRLLEERLGVPVNSHNGGKSGNNVLHSVFILIAKVLPLRPDIVVVMHNANDLGVLSTYGTYWPDSTDFGHIRQPRRDAETAIRTLRDATVPHTYRALRRVLSDAGPLRFGGTAHAAQPPPPRSIDASGAAFESALIQLVETARAWRVPIVLMTQVVSSDDTVRPAVDDGGDYLAPEKLARRGFSADAFASAHAFFNQIVRHTAAARGAGLIDLAMEQHWMRAERYDGLHFNDAGSVAIAGHIAGALEPMARQILAGRAPAAATQR